MKQSLAIAGFALVAFANIAICDDTTGAKAPSAVSASIRPSSCATWPTCDLPTRPTKEKGVPNFGKLNNSVWRSGQPSREGYDLLASEGLKTVVNLREEFPQDKDLLPPGINYVYIPIKDDHAPTAEQAKQFIETVSNPDNWPVLVHCKGGEGRAGTMAAAVRHSFDGWDKARIMNEVGNFRTKHLGFIKMSMPSCQRDFIDQWNSTPGVALQIPKADSVISSSAGASKK